MTSEVSTCIHPTNKVLVKSHGGFFASDEKNSNVLENKVHVVSQDEAAEEQNEGLLDTSLCFVQGNGALELQPRTVQLMNFCLL